MNRRHAYRLTALTAAVAATAVVLALLPDPVVVLAGQVYLAGCALTLLGRAVLAVWTRFTRATSTTCPLCKDTPYAALEYDVDQLRQHALVHSIESIRDWSVEHAPDEVAVAVDRAFWQIEDSTTAYGADVDGTWSWMCQRCWGSSTDFPTFEAAQADRRNHRCPA